MSSIVDAPAAPSSNASPLDGPSLLRARRSAETRAVRRRRRRRRALCDGGGRRQRRERVRVWVDDCQRRGAARSVTRFVFKLPSARGYRERQPLQRCRRDGRSGGSVFDRRVAARACLPRAAAASITRPLP